jgi:hypothetical protein
MPQPPDSARVQRALETVYRRAEFNPQEHVSAWDRFWDMVARGWNWLVGHLDGVRALKFSSPILYWIIVAWLALAALAILGHLLWTVVSATRGPRERAGVEPGTPRVRAGRPRDADDWDEEARRLAAAGRLREAVLALYQALLLRLDRRGALRFDPSKTPGDYRREVRAHPDAARTLTGFLRGFEPVAFGGRDVDTQAFESLRAAARTEGARG